MPTNDKKTIAVFGATGHQGGGVVGALQAGGQFRVRALTRDPGKHAGLADEVVAADLDRPETLGAALAGAHGVFLVTNFWEPGGADEITQARAAIQAAKQAGVQHFVWSTLPNVEAVSGGAYDVPHFTNKAKVDALVAAAGFAHHTFVVAPSFYQNLVGPMGAARPQPDGSTGWTLPIAGGAPIHMGDITELGDVVAGAFAHPDLAGRGAYLPLVGDLLGYGDVVATLNAQGHDLTYTAVPADAFATFFPGAGELAQMFGYIERHGYLGAPMADEIALATRVAGRRPTAFADWARAHMPAAAGRAPAVAA